MTFRNDKSFFEIKTNKKGKIQCLFNFNRISILFGTEVQILDRFLYFLPYVLEMASGILYTHFEQINNVPFVHVQ